MPKALTIARYPAEDILSQMKKKNRMEVTVNNQTYQVRLGSLRLRTFERRTVCVCCGRVGTEMGLDLPHGTDKPHFNLYCVEKSGKRVLMTKDHVIPKSKGGKNHISNMQTMCCKCNAKKGDKSPEEYAAYLEARRKSQPKKS